MITGNSLLGIAPSGGAAIDPGHAHHYGVPLPGQSWSSSPWAPERMRHALAMRLHVPHGHILPFYWIECVKLENDVAVIVVATSKSEPIIIKDGCDLFPSDTLITQLRLLK